MRNFLQAGFLILMIFTTCGGKKQSVATKVNEPGKPIFIKYCLACHQANGSGVPGMFPPLIKTNWVENDKTRLIGIILKGQVGEIEVNGRVYKGAMPSHQYLNDEQVADVLTYIRSNFGNSADSVTPLEVSKVRNQLKAKE